MMTSLQVSYCSEVQSFVIAEVILLIFILQIFEFEKTKNNTVKVEFKDHVENLLTEKFNQKILLEDVQIIHR